MIAESSRQKNVWKSGRRKRKSRRMMGWGCMVYSFADVFMLDISLRLFFALV